MAFDKYDTRSTTEALMGRMLREQYPDLEFQTNARLAGFRPDFYFPAHKAVLEIDGSIHDDLAGQEKDRKKDARYKARGLMVFRLRNADIWNNPYAAVHVVASTLGIFKEGEDQEQVWRNYSRRRPQNRGVRPRNVKPSPNI
jgi:very-short-patch-repair endonuclease